MYPRLIRNVFSDKELKEIAKLLHKYFPLVGWKRIYDLILQVDSVDRASEFLMLHKNNSSGWTIDFIVYNYLHNKVSNF